MDENYVIYSELEADGRFKVKCSALILRSIFRIIWNRETVQFFSPPRCFLSGIINSLLSVEEDDYAIYVESSFSRENRLIFGERCEYKVYQTRT